MIIKPNQSHAQRKTGPRPGSHESPLFILGLGSSRSLFTAFGSTGLESFDSAGCVKNLFGSGIKRVAGTANFNLKFLFG